MKRETNDSFRRRGPQKSLEKNSVCTPAMAIISLLFSVLPSHQDQEAAFSITQSNKEGKSVLIMRTDNCLTQRKPGPHKSFRLQCGWYFSGFLKLQMGHGKPWKMKGVLLKQKGRPGDRLNKDSQLRKQMGGKKLRDVSIF